MRQQELVKLLGPIDLYLLDQVMRGQLSPGQRILDAGCGDGRNQFLLLRLGYEVYGLDRAESAVAEARTHARIVDPGVPDDRIQQGDIERMPWDDAFFDAVVCNAVLHFAENTKQFRAMLDECWRVLRPGGLFFARLASKTGQGGQLRRLAPRRYTLPDGTDRFLVDAAFLGREETRIGARRAEPLKSLIVHGQRTMDTWVLRKL